jgi:hypothetical protein
MHDKNTRARGNIHSRMHAAVFSVSRHYGLRAIAYRYNKRTGLSTFHKPSCIGTRADKEAGNDMAWLDGLQAGSNVLSSNRVI